MSECNYLVSYSKDLPQADKDIIEHKLNGCLVGFIEDEDYDDDEVHYYSDYNEESCNETDKILSELNSLYPNDFSWDFGN